MVAKRSSLEKETPVPAGRYGTQTAVAAVQKAAGLDRLVHERVRLGILSSLAVSDPCSFNELKALLRTTDGNLSIHARRLEEAGYIRCTKSFEGRIPRTEFSLTPEGRRALERYLNHMEALIEATRGGEQRQNDE